MKVIEATVNYLRGAVTELHQVRWPTRNQAVRLSVIVIAFTLASALLYGVVDFILGQGMALLLHVA